MSIPDAFKPLMPAVRDTLLRGGMSEDVANAITVGLIVGANWARSDVMENMPAAEVHVLGVERTVDELAKDILAAREAFNPESVPPRRSS